ncbi:tRNA (adenosine(37)-N6)-threonylcarbamoyltransferase complex dimerization subunit type 1 TsaB [Sulfitobacter donghicola]|uniref:Peptidase M22 n=1 Tax=Sulfitobacter donghicola DSW-25 = KCTC 12864 = JCM 14565 TaxID=1300350 RepID=A0A073IJJ5_9RHOB|nr:tRNA (adenosine(37)-N6)-threonylcarbamoyltransferase complex dimerization subunit type 1 TsaB [Sulfitobacter donghicola]KEJ89770.1 peptidase M22 [Sulfitobacter donghicola DSW-25 = KCTC 12864 = JCM 14565]KIN67124.1 Glycoprotease family protein [Sulfitobacter donghicola DSW-25 = KCTC 12864 = JCM 14565]
MSAPLILSLDTSAAHCAAAVLLGDKVLATREEPMAKGQAERLLVLAQELLTEAGKTFDQLDAIGVGIGPGNFTGIRIAVSAARGLAMGLGIPAVGVSAFQALQYGTSAPCICAVDGRRDMVFLQGFEGAPFQEPALHARTDIPPDARVIGAFGQPPAYPVAVAIGHIAAEQYGTVSQPPAPLYLRPADAAPARDAPPQILP